MLWVYLYGNDGRGQGVQGKEGKGLGGTSSKEGRKRTFSMCLDV